MDLILLSFSQLIMGFIMIAAIVLFLVILHESLWLRTTEAVLFPHIQHDSDDFFDQITEFRNDFSKE